MISLFKYSVLCASFLCVNAYVDTAVSRNKHALDLKLYEEAIDLEQCDKQLDYITTNNTELATRFMDTSFKIPRNILKGNFRDAGSYFACLEISHQTQDMNIEGKYNMITIPLRQDNFEIPWIPIPDWTRKSGLVFYLPELNKTYDGKFFSMMANYENARYHWHGVLGDRVQSRVPSDSSLAGLQMELAMCMPKVCTAKHVLNTLTMNLTESLTVQEAFVRLPNDKQWVAAGCVSAILFSIIGLLTVLSTAYDLRHTFLLKKDSKQANKTLTLFSLYTNAKNFCVFQSSPSTITCLDGIRSFAMMWVIIGHTFSSQLSYNLENILDVFEFMMSFWSLWITSATVTVDTFFAISGILLVYTAASKVSGMTLFKKLHLFYFNRILRILPVLAAMVLIQASFLHRMADGPYWDEISHQIHTCRVYWWSTLLFIQNWTTYEKICMPHTWYLAVDMQLYIASPLLLFWILGKRSRIAWAALATTLVASLTGATVYNFINNFQAGGAILGGSAEEQLRYINHYYMSTLNRISPFIVGMIVGYILHLNRRKTVRISWFLVGLGWILAAAASLAVVVTSYVTIQSDWDNQFVDNLIKSSTRPVWAASVGWMVFACHHSYGGPINWLLSLHIFKILGRLSYAMYIVHNPLQFLLNATALQPIYFATNLFVYRFIVDFIISVIGAYLLIVIIDYPFTNIIKMALGGGGITPAVKTTAVVDETEVDFKTRPDSHNAPYDDNSRRV